MKKGLAILIAAMFILAVVLGGGVTVISADNVLVGHAVMFEGVGVVNLDLDVQTEAGYEGLKLSDNLYSPGNGYGGKSYIKYNSNLELGMYNETNGNATTDMEYIQTIEVVNAKHRFVAKNYMVGAASGFKYTGDVGQNITVYADNTLSESLVSGEVHGDMTLFERVVDPATGVIIVKDTSNIVGKYKYLYNTYAEIETFPAAGEDNWLGCP